MESYRTAILQNKECFKGKAVLDVGAGSGVLAIWAAMAGARVVYAVEATSMAKQARRLAEANGVGHIVHVYEGYMEQVSRARDEVALSLAIPGATTALSR
jgi:protein arginine N-methyltransferase 1